MHYQKSDVKKTKYPPQKKKKKKRANIIPTILSNYTQARHLRKEAGIGFATKKIHKRMWKNQQNEEEESILRLTSYLAQGISGTG